MSDLSIPPQRDLPTGRLGARRRHLLAEAAAGLERPPRPRWAVPRWMLVPAAAAVVAAAFLAVERVGNGPSPASAAVRVTIAPLAGAGSAAGSARSAIVDVGRATRAREHRHGDVEIVGATPAQASLLRRILAGMPATALTRIAVEDATVGGVAGVRLRFDAVAGDPLRSDWEEMLLAGSFRAFSAHEGLPPVLGLPPERTVSSETTAGAAAQLARTLRQAAARDGAAVEELDVYRPQGLAPLVVLRVDDPAAFLAHRLPRFLATMGDTWRDYDGTFVEVVDGDGAFVWAAGTDPLVSHGSVATRPGLAGCSPVVNLGSTPPPCPAA